MAYRGFYKRRRGILEHLEAGRISLLDSAIHDYLCLKANSIVGNGDFYPPGTLMCSAEAIHACCPRNITAREVRRSLQHLEELGWIKRWMNRGKRGNYPVMVERFIVRELTGKQWKEYTVNADATTDWRKPVLIPVASDHDVTARVSWSGHGSATLKEVRTKKQSLPAKKRQADPRHKPIRDHYQKRSQEITGVKAQWDGADGEALNRWLGREHDKGEGFLKGWLDNAFNSTDPYPLRAGFRFTEFERHCAKYAKGPLRKGEVASRNQKPLDQQYSELEHRRAGQGVN